MKQLILVYYAVFPPVILYNKPKYMKDVMMYYFFILLFKLQCKLYVTDSRLIMVLLLHFPM